MTPKTWKKHLQKLLIIGLDPFISQSSPDHSPQPTAQNWFFILWNLGTRHLFSYLCSAFIPLQKTEVIVPSTQCIILKIVGFCILLQSINQSNKPISNQECFFKIYCNSVCCMMKGTKLLIEFIPTFFSFILGMSWCVWLELFLLLWSRQSSNKKWGPPISAFFCHYLKLQGWLYSKTHWELWTKLSIIYSVRHNKIWYYFSEYAVGALNWGFEVPGRFQSILLHLSLLFFLINALVLRTLCRIFSFGILLP